MFARALCQCSFLCPSCVCVLDMYVFLYTLCIFQLTWQRKILQIEFKDVNLMGILWKKDVFSFRLKSPLGILYKKFNQGPESSIGAKKKFETKKIVH